MHGAKADEKLLAEYPMVDFLLQILNVAEVQDVILKYVVFVYLWLKIKYLNI